MTYLPNKVFDFLRANNTPNLGPQIRRKAEEEEGPVGDTRKLHNSPITSFDIIGTLLRVRPEQIISREVQEVGF